MADEGTPAPSAEPPVTPRITYALAIQVGADEKVMLVRSPIGGQPWEAPFIQVPDGTEDAEAFLRGVASAGSKGPGLRPSTLKIPDFTVIQWVGTCVVGDMQFIGFEVRFLGLPRPFGAYYNADPRVESLKGPHATGAQAALALIRAILQRPKSKAEVGG